MNAAFILLALSAATGFAIGTSFSWFAILISSTALAAVSAAVPQIAGFDALSGIAIIATCLAVHQFAYVMGVAVARRASKDVNGGQDRYRIRRRV
jgi:tetrahydromethanopterin S-methyltransferase subunit D